MERMVFCKCGLNGTMIPNKQEDGLTYLWLILKRKEEDLTAYLTRIGRDVTWDEEENPLCPLCKSILIFI